MRRVGQGLRAVFVEMIGVVLVLWLLYGTAAWTVGSHIESRALAATASQSRLWPAADQGPRFLISGTSGSSMANPNPAKVGRRLDYYSRLYRDAAENYLARLGQ